MTSGGIDLLASCLLGKVTLEIIAIIWIWSAISHCLIWCIWMEKNAKCFEGLESSISSVKFILFKSLYEWLSASGQFSFSNFIWVTRSLLFCTILVGASLVYFTHTCVAPFQFLTNVLLIINYIFISFFIWFCSCENWKKFDNQEEFGYLNGWGRWKTLGRNRTEDLVLFAFCIRAC